jgi:ribonuclease HII
MRGKKQDMLVQCAQDLLPFVSGVDEAGRGPLAGPVVAAAVVLPTDYRNTEVADSKRLSEKKRHTLYAELKESALAYSIVSVGPREIEEFNIRVASRLAMERAAVRVSEELRIKFPSMRVHFLVDGNMPLEQSFSSEAIVKGDSKIVAISAASILAKVKRDSLMKEFEHEYPGYGFAQHKGYPTKTHREAIISLGPCQIHRRTFSGVKEYI